VSLDSKQIEFYDENGYLIIDNFFTNKELEEFKQSLIILIRQGLQKISKTHPEINPEEYVGKELDEGMIKLENVDHSFVGNIYDTLYQVPEFLRIISKPEISKCVNQLLKTKQDSPIYTYLCRCRFDPPENERRATRWHQEVLYTIPKTKLVQTWAPLIIDATPENGSIKFCVGSHRDGIAKVTVPNAKKVTLSESGNDTTPFKISDDIIQKYKIETVKMKKGQIMIFHPKLIHKSGINSTNKVRYSLVGMYHDTVDDNFEAPSINFKFRNADPVEYVRKLFTDKKNER
tara:strand:+ start:633 stop:1499 length:867 start_codon:yes stop_codon:yes gene_type:complete